MKFLILFYFVALAYSRPSYEWNAWKTQYNKKYMSQAEENYRYAVWKDNLEYVTEQNDKITYELGMNHLADLVLNPVHGRDILTSVVPCLDTR